MTPTEHRESIVAEFTREFRAKYDKGQAEHGGNLSTHRGLLNCAIEEGLDNIAYLYSLRQQQRERSPMPVVYVAGPFRGKDSWEMEQNIRRAEALSLEVWRLGCAAVCPHTNTRFFQGAADDAVWLTGDLAILSRCDAVLMTADWERSQGATAERDFALAHGIPVLYRLDALREWASQTADTEAPRK